MPTSPVSSVIEHIQRSAPSDGELLGCFIECRDETALATLVKRHGPMVWGVCRRLLSHHDAEDAFQAAFIVLVRKAASVNPRDMVGNWLYGVARQAALQARSAARRRAREIQVDQMPDTEVPHDQWADVRPILDEELSRLPDYYRAVIVLCDLEGRSRRDVATHLGCPEGTVASRLVRAREMLARRLAGRGIAWSGGALVLTVSAAVPVPVVASTIKAVSLCGQAAIPAKVAALAEGVLKAMLMSKLKIVMSTLLVAALVGYGAARGQKCDAPQKDEKPKIEAVLNGKAEKKETTAWGKEVDGLQMGLATDAHTVRQGEQLKLMVKLRNVGKADIKVTHGLLKEYPPNVTTADGGEVIVFMPIPKGYKVKLQERIIKPGESVTLYEPEVGVESEARARLLGEMLVDTPTICVTPGKYKIAFGGMVQSHPTLTTGTAEFEVKEPPIPVAAFTEWGIEIGGLQAGLGFKAGEKRAYKHGETVTLVVRVRNVGKETVEFRYVRQFFLENPPAVTDSKGKSVPLERVTVFGFHALVPVNLAPGKEVEVGERQLELKPTLYGTGKFSVQYERLETPENDETLSKLATGKLELEINDKAPEKPDGPSGSRAPSPAEDKRAEAQTDSTSEYPTADIVVQYPDGSGRELKQFRVKDAETVAKLASHFPGILGDRGNGPRVSAGKRAMFTIKFHHKSGEVSQARVAHVTPDFATWCWRDNTPYTGDRQVEGKDQLQSLLEGLAAKNKVDLK